MSRFWSPIVKELQPYTPGEQPKISNLIKLNTNENPYGPSPKVLAALEAEIDSKLRLYPDPNADQLKTAIAQYYALDNNQVFVGNGSDEVLAHIFYGLLQHNNPILFPDITYSFYPVYCGLYGISYEPIPLTDKFEINIDNYQHPNGGIIFPNPNAPTGQLLPLTTIKTLLNRNQDSVVVIDEAYIDFGGESATPLIKEFPNLLIVQTFSKSRSLAGLRIGFALGNPDLIEALDRVKNSFNSYPIDKLAIKAGVAAIADRTYFEEITHKIIQTRETLVNHLHQLGFQVIPSQANFVFVSHPRYEAEKLSQALRNEGIIVRHFRINRIKNFLRITIGTEDQSTILVKSLSGIIE